MATKVRLPQTRFISSVTLAIGRILVTTKSGKERSFPYERLTAKQEARLRSMAQPIAKRREVKASRETGKPRKRVNYAELATKQPVFVTAGGRQTVVEV